MKISAFVFFLFTVVGCGSADSGGTASSDGTASSGVTASMESSLLVTFETPEAFQSATAESLLQGVKYDRSEEVKLEKNDEDKSVKLSLWTDAMSATALEDAIEKIKHSPGVKDVQDSFAFETEEISEAIAEEIGNDTGEAIVEGDKQPEK